MMEEREERDILFKCLNCRENFEVNIGDFIKLKCPKCGNQPTPESLKAFKAAVNNMYTVETSKESFGFDFQYPSKSIY